MARLEQQARKIFKEKKAEVGVTAAALLGLLAIACDSNTNTTSLTPTPKIEPTAMVLTPEADNFISEEAIRKYKEAFEFINTSDIPGLQKVARKIEQLKAENRFFAGIVKPGDARGELDSTVQLTTSNAKDYYLVFGPVYYSSDIESDSAQILAVRIAYDLNRFILIEEKGPYQNLAEFNKQKSSPDIFRGVFELTHVGVYLPLVKGGVIPSDNTLSPWVEYWKSAK